MTTLSHIVEPSALLLTWQSLNVAHADRTRRVIGEVRIDPSSGEEFTFKYLDGTADWGAAIDAGFQGYPAFKIDSESRFYGPGVRETLMRRLPPMKREDFPDFLASHSLPNPFPLSDLALLGYTGARLPGDGFALIPVFPADRLPCEFITEVAGVRHVFKGDVSSIHIGDPVEFKHESDNAVESDAIAVFHSLGKIGYVNRALLPTFHEWMQSGTVEGVVERMNGNPARPLVFVRIEAC